MNPFHLAIPVYDITEARRFYTGVLRCREGRSAASWIDFDFYGHQLVCHLDKTMRNRPRTFNPVDGHAIPIPHFGIVLDMENWQEIADRLTANGVDFAVEPHVRFKGQPGEQGTLFIYDPSGNAIEIKGFADMSSQLFAT